MSAPYGRPAVCSSIQAQLHVELLGTVAAGAQHTKTARVGDGGHHIPAVAERQEREVDAEQVADRRSHRRPPYGAAGAASPRLA